MLNKESAVELQLYSINKIGNVDIINIENVRWIASLYLVEYCSDRDVVSDIFSEETIAYCYGLLQGLK